MSSNTDTSQSAARKNPASPAPLHYRWKRPELHHTQLPGSTKITNFALFAFIIAAIMGGVSFSTGDYLAGWWLLGLSGVLFNIMLIVAAISAVTTEIRIAALEAAIRAGDATPIMGRDA
jgi:hypothetical protein